MDQIHFHNEKIEIRLVKILFWFYQNIIHSDQIQLKYVKIQFHLDRNELNFDKIDFHNDQIRFNFGEIELHLERIHFHFERTFSFGEKRHGKGILVNAIFGLKNYSYCYLIYVISVLSVNGLHVETWMFRMTSHDVAGQWHLEACPDFRATRTN